MTEAPTQSAAAAQSVEALTAEIEQTREQLGETVQALAEKANVKAHVQEKVAERKQAVARVWHRVDARVAGAAVGGVAALAVLVCWRRR